MPIDYSKYCSDWKLRSRFIRFYRAKNHCEVCGVENGSLILRGTYDNQEVYQDMDGGIFNADTGQRVGDDYLGEVDPDNKNKLIQIVLTVAHLDHNIQNNSFFNLKAMCQRCHLRYDAKHHAKSRRRNRNKHQLILSF